MKINILVMSLILATAFGADWKVSAAQDPSELPFYNNENRLALPQNYREWIYVSSGLGMEYGDSRSGAQKFTNVFVAPSAYREFVRTGQWPDKTVFVLEGRASSSQGSINKGGQFQADLASLSAAVKDEKRFPEKWAYFTFGNQQTAAPNPKARCWQCHNEHGAVDNTFVQFYPTLKKAAQARGTYNEEKAAAQTGSK